jgi:hypothetical protein
VQGVRANPLDCCKSCSSSIYLSGLATYARSLLNQRDELHDISLGTGLSIVVISLCVDIYEISFLSSGSVVFQ